MLRKTFLFCSALSACISLAMIGAANSAAPANLTAAQIIEKNVSAKGGLQAWRAVQTITLSGKMEAGGKQTCNCRLCCTKSDPGKRGSS
jgi:hypothetical protein